MAQPVKFAFDSVFAIEGSDETTEARDFVTPQELEAAQAKAYEEGFAAGVAEEHARNERRYADAVEAIAARMGAIEQTQRAEIERCIRSATELALSIARKVAPALMAAAPMAEIEALIGEHLEQLVDEPRVVVRVSEGMVDALRERIDALAAARGFSGRMVLIPDAALADGDCRMEWADGGVERDTAAVWKNLEGAIARILAAAGAPAAARAQAAPKTPDPADPPAAATAATGGASPDPA